MGGLLTVVFFILFVLGVVFCALVGRDSPSSPPKKGNRGNPLRDWKDSLTEAWSGSVTIRFVYKKPYEDPEERTVTVQKIRVSSSEKPYLFGKCHLREEQRCFDMERIKGAVFLCKDNTELTKMQFLQSLVGKDRVYEAQPKKRSTKKRP